MARTLRVCRLYKTENSVVAQARNEVMDQLAKLLTDHGGWTLRFTPTEIYLGSEAVVHPKRRVSRDENPSAGEERLPFVFYRDGIRGLRLPVQTPREELDALFEALRVVGGGPLAQEDLVTLLWQANLTNIRIDSVPLEQSIYLSSSGGGNNAGEGGAAGVYARTAVGAEIHSDLGQEAGSRGLHKDTFDDWYLADTQVEVPQAYTEMLPAMEYSRAHFRAALEEELSRNWTLDAPLVFREMISLDPGEEMRQGLAHSVATWVGGALQRTSLEEAQEALGLLMEFDPDLSRSAKDIGAILSQLDHSHLADYLDEAEPEEQARFAALAVGLGKPAVDLAFSVLTRSSKGRTRAAASTALCYLCAEEPELLEPYLADPREEAVLDIVFLLGQIGGPGVVNLLRLASQHPHPRVRKQVVQSLGAVPTTARIPQLLKELDSTDQQVFNATLNMLAREKNPHVARALIKRIAAPDFETRGEESRRAVFSALAEIADDDVVPMLEEQLTQGGWFARRTNTRVGVARTLLRMGTRDAMAALQRGLKSRNAAVRMTCQEVLEASGP